MIYVISSLFIISPLVLSWVLTSKFSVRTKVWIIGIAVLVMLITPILAMWILGGAFGGLT